MRQKDNWLSIRFIFQNKQNDDFAELEGAKWLLNVTKMRALNETSCGNSDSLKFFNIDINMAAFVGMQILVKRDKQIMIQIYERGRKEEKS